MIVLLFVVSAFTYSIELELKLGLDVYRELSVDATGHKPTGIYPGGSVGMEALVSEKNPFRYGLGMVWHNSANGKSGYEGHSTSPLYIVGKYKVKDDVYFIGRAGWAFAKAGDATNVKGADGGLYGAFGVGKEFMENKMNLELLYEIMEYEYNTTFATEEDGYYQIFSIVFSYKLWATR